MSNWTDQRTKALRMAYVDKDNTKLPEIAKEFAVSVASIRMKLVGLGIYEKTEKVKKEPSAKKSELIAKLAGLLGRDKQIFNSMTVKALEAVLQGLEDARINRGEI